MNPRILIRSMVLLVLTFIGSIIFLLAAKPQSAELPELPTLVDGDNPYADLFIPDFKLTDSNNELLEESILDGRYTVIDFFYTSCPLICPGMTAAMKKIQDETADTDLQLLSISIDPEVDTTEVIKNYAQTHKADPKRWRFATGDMEMLNILLMGMNFNLSDLSDDKGYREIDHPATLILLGPDRHVIKLYRYADPDQLNELIKTARKLAG